MQSEEAIYDEFVGQTNAKSDLYFVWDIFIFLLVAASLSYVANLLDNRILQLNAVQLAIYVTLGVVHVLAFNRSAFIAFSPLKKFGFTLMLCVLISIVLYVADFYYHSASAAMVFFKGLAFGLPALVYYHWTLFDSLRRSSNKNKVWFGFENVMDGKVTVYLNSVPIKIKITKKYYEELEEIIETTFPGHMIFGKIFNKFLLDLNEETEIELYDEINQSFGWVFFEKRKHSYEVRCLDPELTVRENKIKDGSTIIARRVKREIAS